MDVLWHTWFSIIYMSSDCTLCLKESRQYDPHYRYKMPPLDASTDNRSKQRKTHLHNSAVVAKNCFRPEAWLVKYLALHLSTDSGVSRPGTDAFLTGHHATTELQPLVFSFIREYVLCKCGSPETLLHVHGKKRDKVCRLRCHSCGRDGRCAGQDEKMLNLFAAQPMAPELCPMGGLSIEDPPTVDMTTLEDDGANASSSTTTSTSTSGSAADEPGHAAASQESISPRSFTTTPRTRILFVRHGKQQSTSERSNADRHDPPLSDKGHQQAAQRATELAAELRQCTPLLVVSSPMRRALMTAAPAATALGVSTVLVHGGCYEYGCAGADFGGSGLAAIREICPDATLTHLGPAGEWACEEGSSDQESAVEAKARVRKVTKWLREEVVPQARGGAAILFAHQTFLDLLLQLLLTGSDDAWTYGMPRHKLAHTGVARVVVRADGEMELDKG